jgi:signal peptidase I
MQFPLTVEEGCIFAMGDNRNISRDSRYPEIGQIDTREILGRAVFLMVPGTNTPANPQPRDFARIGVIG